MATKEKVRQPDLMKPANEVLANECDAAQGQPIHLPAMMPVAATPMTILQSAVERGATVEQLERLTALVERWQDREAQAKFAEALNKFQSLCPTVFKRRQTKAQEGSNFAYNFASFDDIMRQASPALAECGIGIGFDTDHNLEKGILTVTCRLRVGSYFEDRKFACPVASSLKISDAQKFGSALSYAKRYCLCAALNIVTTDQDDDGQGTFEYIEQAQADELKALIKEKNANLTKFLAWAECESIEKMLKCDYPKARDMLMRKARVES